MPLPPMPPAPSLTARTLSSTTALVTSAIDMPSRPIVLSLPVAIELPVTVLPALPPSEMPWPRNTSSTKLSSTQTSLALELMPFPAML